MRTDSAALYEAWELTAPPVPPRSRLYALAPVGLGTPEVESLTSYLVRLAAAHGVMPRTLVAREVLPRLGRAYLTRGEGNQLFALHGNDARAINGTQALARDWVAALSCLTRRQDLRYLTLLPWAAVLPTLGLLRPAQAWCPACYGEWRDAGRPVYQPLRWSLAVVTACPRHRRGLAEHCPRPTCRRQQAPLANQARPGYCAWCSGWLGDPAGPPGADLPVDEATLAWQAWVGDVVGALLAAAPALPATPQRTDLTAALRRWVAHLGSAAALARATGVAYGTVAIWRQGKGIPHLPLLLQLCAHLSSTPAQFFGGGAVPGHPPRAAPMPPVIPPLPRRTTGRFDHAALGRELEAVLQAEEAPPPAMRQVARRLGCSPAHLHHQFPALCRAISARYLAHRREQARQTTARRRQEVRQATLALHATGRYPSSTQVARRLAHPGRFRHPDANAAWHETLRELGWEP